jgi:hypothetical protein
MSGSVELTEAELRILAKFPEPKRRPKPKPTVGWMLGPNRWKQTSSGHAIAPVKQPPLPLIMPNDDRVDDALPFDRFRHRFQLVRICHSVFIRKRIYGQVLW